VKININDFSKQALVGIVEAARDKDVLPDKTLGELQHMDLVRRLSDGVRTIELLSPEIDAQQAKLRARSPKKKLQTFNKLVGRYKRLNKSCNDIIKKLRVLEKAFPGLKTGGAGGES